MEAARLSAQVLSELRKESAALQGMAHKDYFWSSGPFGEVDQLAEEAEPVVTQRVPTRVWVWGLRFKGAIKA